MDIKNLKLRDNKQPSASNKRDVPGRLISLKNKPKAKRNGDRPSKQNKQYLIILAIVLQPTNLYLRQSLHNKIIKFNKKI